MNEMVKTYDQDDSETKRRVFWTDVTDKIAVSTVFLCLNHGYSGVPILFETMINRGDGWEDESQQRYPNAQEARKGHLDAVDSIRKELGLPNPLDVFVAASHEKQLATLVAQFRAGDASSAPPLADLLGETGHRHAEELAELGAIIGFDTDEQIVMVAIANFTLLLEDA